MTREAVMEGFEQFVGDAIQRTGAAFSVSRAIGAEEGGMIDKFVSSSDAIHEKIIEPELQEYETRTVEQFDVILEWVQSDDPLEVYRDDILASGPFVHNIRDDIPAEQREAARERLLARHESLGRAVEPLVAAPETEFWESAVTTLERERAERLIEHHFAFTGPLRDQRQAFEMRKTIDPEELVSGLGSILGDSSFEVDFTDEALRAMTQAEREVIEEAKAEVENRFE